MPAAWTAALATALAAVRAGAWRTTGELPTFDGAVHYAGKFCFDYAPKQDTAGSLYVTLADQPRSLKVIDDSGKDEPAEGEVFLMVFDDEDEHWQEAYSRWNELSCEERKQLSSKAFPLSKTTEMIVDVHQSIRPRWWYFAFVNCGAPLEEPVKYELHARNPTHGFQSEFGTDADFSLPLQAAFFLLFSMVAAAAVTAAGLPGQQSGRMPEASRPRPWLRLLQASCILSALGCGLSTLDHFVYAFDGWGVRWAALLSSVAVCGAKLSLSLLQLLVAGGWALVGAQNEKSARMRSTVCAATLGIFLLTISCELHQEYGRDTATAVYLYESWPGCIILLLNICLLVVSASLMRDTYRKERVAEVRTFYKTLSFAIGLYYVSLPAVCLVATLLSPWVRLKYVQLLEISTRFLVTVLLLRWLRPSHLDGLINNRLEEAGRDDCDPEQSRPALDMGSDSEAESQSTVSTVSGVHPQAPL